MRNAPVVLLADQAVPGFGVAAARLGGAPLGEGAALDLEELREERDLALGLAKRTDILSTICCAMACATFGATFDATFSASPTG